MRGLAVVCPNRTYSGGRIRKNTVKSAALCSMKPAARHCQPKTEKKPTRSRTHPKQARTGTILPHQHLFCGGPYPEGWYPADDERAPVPIMGGAVPSTAGEETAVSASGETTVIQTVCVPCGSGSGSYVTSCTTSYRTGYSGSDQGSFGSVPARWSATTDWS